MSTSLAVKYRPHDWSEICDQSSIIKILTQQIVSNQLKNAYLFCGASGCGKTTIARIFANKMNDGVGTPIEIDGASNNGVDNVKSIIKAAQERSIDSKYKVYIIDECFDGSVEVLTDKGFKRFDSLDKTELIAQYTDEGTIEFVTPTEYICRYYEGDMYEVSFRNGRRTCLMTPHHVQPLRVRDSGKIKESYIQDCKFAQSSEVIVSGKGTGNNNPLTPFEKLMIAAQADGYCGKQLSDGTYNWEFHLKYSLKKQYLVQLLQECGFTYRVYEGSVDENKDSSIQVHLPSNTYKVFSNNFNLSMGVDRAQQFISELLLWDGSTKSGYPGYYSSTCKENVDFVSAVLAQCGYSGCVNTHKYNNPHHNTEYSVNWFYKDGRPGSACSKKLVPYSGNIFCVKVPSHKIVIRVDGFTVVSGNCHALTNQAWQAFLKCIEEPPTYTIFIFCTTDPQKIPATILNRVMRFNFTRISLSKVKERLTYICKMEGYSNYEDSVDYISKISEGGMRNAIALLEKVSSYSTDITMENTLAALGNFSYDTFFKLINSIIDGSEGFVLSIIQKFYDEGTDLKLFVDQFINFCLDVQKYCIFKSFDMIKIPVTMQEQLESSVNFDNAHKYYTYFIDKLLSLKNMLKNDSSPKSTIEVVFLQMVRLV